ncbi:MAG TPA: NAD-binding protein [Anaerolineaceae bacterium]
MSKRTSQRFWRRIRASWRDTLLLFREFRQPLIWFLAAITGLGLLYRTLSQNTPDAISNPIEAIYLAVTLAFFQPSVQFPSTWYLQVFFFLIPLIGIGLLAQGLADFAIMLFNRRARGKDWEMAVASTYRNHVILVGLGHLGFRVVNLLTGLDQEVVVIEMKPKPNLLAIVRAAGVPVIEDDASNSLTLEAASIRYAKSIMLCTQDDNLNLQVALKARSLNPKLDIIIRIFDDDFAEALHNQFGFKALSATSLAAPIFASSAADIDITPPVVIGGKPQILAKICVLPSSRLCGNTIMDIEEINRMSVVALMHEGITEHHPKANRQVIAGDTLVLFGDPDKINRLVYLNNPS